MFRKEQEVEEEKRKMERGKFRLIVWNVVDVSIEKGR